MTTLADLNQAQLDDLRAQVGPAMDAPGFNLDAHISANTHNGVFTPPVYTGGSSTSSNSSSITTNPAIAIPTIDIPLPEIGTPEYQALLLETGRSDLNGFNYAAHLAVKQNTSLSSFDLYYEAADGAELIKMLGQVNVNELMASSSSAQVQALVKKFANDPVFEAYLNTTTSSLPTIIVGGKPATVSQFVQSTDTVALPAFGSDAYKALLLETGRSDLIGFNYAAHLAAKSNTSLINFDTYYNAVDGTALVQLLGQVDKNILMSQASPAQVQLLIAKFANDPVFKVYLDSETKVELPAVGSAAYQQLLTETGRTDLKGFDYDAHLKALTEAYCLIEKTGLTSLENNAVDLVGTIKADKIIQTNIENGILCGGQGNDKIYGNIGNDTLIGGVGADQMSGGKGDDTYFIENKLDKLIELKDGGTDTVVSEINIVLANNFENIILNGGNLSATGNVLNNTIIGTEGNNKINGGLGCDILTGGLGQDTFIISNKLSNNNIDTITDFSGDLIGLNKSIFKSLSNGINISNIVIGSGPLEPTDYLIFNQGCLYYDPDGSGSKPMTCFVALIGDQITLDPSSFVLL